MGIPFGTRSALTVLQRGGTHKTGEQMNPTERRNYVSKVKAELQAQAEKKRKKKPVPKKGAGQQPKSHNKYYK
jgi:hypothetical protein